MKNLSINQATNVLVEHNVFWGLNWSLEIKGQAEIRYNLVLDNEERGWVLIWDDVGPSRTTTCWSATRDDSRKAGGRDRRRDRRRPTMRRRRS